MITWTFHQLSLTGNHCCSWLVQNDFWEKFTQNSSRHGEWWGNWGCLVLPKASLKHQQKEYCGYFQHHLGMNVSSLGYIHPRIYSLRYSGSTDLQHLWSTILSLSWVLRSKLTFGGWLCDKYSATLKRSQQMLMINNKCWWLSQNGWIINVCRWNSLTNIHSVGTSETVEVKWDGHLHVHGVL